MAPKSPPQPPPAAPPPAPEPPKYDGPPTTRVRAIQTGFKQWKLIKETFTGPPTTTEVLVEGRPLDDVQYRVRLFAEEWLGYNRYPPDSGLE